MFYKEKGFYISIVTGILTIIAFAGICMNVLGPDSDDKLPDTENYLAEATNTPEAVPQPTANPESEAVAKIDPAKTAKPEKTEEPAGND